jgi:hypothetical protein
MAATQGSEQGPQGPPQVPGYRVGEPLGAGGSGSVWAATRGADGLRCAVKVVPVGDDDASAAARELAVLARVAVEGLVGFHEAVVLGDHTAEAVALVLDHVGGGSLDRVVRARGRLSVGESVTVLAPVARTLAGLHALGVVHGDVSPANVLLERSGRPLLGDLGVARLAGELPGEVHGTDGFVAPEVLDGAAVGAAADVYAVGALAWYCVTGAPPGPAALRPPLESLVPGLPPAWQEATTQALRGDPARRPTAAELALAYFDAAACEPLRLVVGSDDTSMLTHRLRNAPVPAPASVGEPGHRGRVVDPPRLRRPSSTTVRALATAVALIALLGTGGLMAAGTVPAPPWLTPQRRDQHPDAVQQARETPPQQDPHAPRTRALGLMQALADLRAQAMESASRSALDDLDAPASPALAADAAELARLRRSGEAYRGVRLVVRHSTATEVAARSARVEAVVDTAAYRVVGHGQPRDQPAVDGERLRFALVWEGGRWLVSRVDAVDGAGAAGP